ncbi:MAG: aminotransferase class V-fold PLP-dependent enzyme [Deltaproteobacteria bacterium]|nr:aminotransferase class V-fold PLP-dependent enzyme [Deltaproteobacteria bacterium]
MALGLAARGHWTLSPAVAYLNHGSYGATPRPVLEAQARLRAELESGPVHFMGCRLEPLLDEARGRLAGLLGARTADLVFVPNATHGVNAVLRSLPFGPGDELLTTDHAYNACRNALDEVADRTGATVTVARLPWPVPSAAALAHAVVGAFTDHTRLLLLDHVTSPTATVLPVEEILPAARSRGIFTLVDGAHAPGMVPLQLTALGADAYTGNCHKWLCAPKGAAFLWVAPAHQDRMRPPAVSHGRNAPRTDRSRFHLEFDWTGTADPTAALCVPAALDFLGGLLPGGLPALMARNAGLARHGRELLARALGVNPPVPDDCTGSMASLPLPPGNAPALHDALYDAGFELPVMPFPAAPARLLRISAQAYNHPGEYEALARALPALLR